MAFVEISVTSRKRDNQFSSVSNVILEKFVSKMCQDSRWDLIKLLASLG